MKKTNVLLSHFIATTIICMSFLYVTNASGAPIVSYSIMGSSSNWTLDFSVTNTLGDSNQIYFFGVSLPDRNITGTPTGWDSDRWSLWNNNFYGGSNIDYNNNWIDRFVDSGSPNMIDPGETLDGFEVFVDTYLAPTSVQWFAYAANGTYTGSDYFNLDENPGFEGVAINVVPEPSTFVLLGAGLAWLAAIGIRRKKS